MAHPGRLAGGDPAAHPGDHRRPARPARGHPHRLPSWHFVRGAAPLEPRHLPAEPDPALGGHRGAPRRHPAPALAGRDLPGDATADHLLLQHRLQVVPLLRLADAGAGAGETARVGRAHDQGDRGLRRGAPLHAAGPHPDHDVPAGAGRPGRPRRARDRHLGRPARALAGAGHRCRGRDRARGARLDQPARVVAGRLRGRSQPPERAGQPGPDRRRGDRVDGALRLGRRPAGRVRRGGRRRALRRARRDPRTAAARLRPGRLAGRQPCLAGPGHGRRRDRRGPVVAGDGHPGRPAHGRPARLHPHHAVPRPPRLLQRRTEHLQAAGEGLQPAGRAARRARGQAPGRRGGRPGGSDDRQQRGAVRRADGRCGPTARTPSSTC